MPNTTEEAELADAFRAETRALVELDERIGRLMRKRLRLEGAFNAILVEVDRLLHSGETSILLIAELTRIDNVIRHNEEELTMALSSATERLCVKLR